MRRDGNFTRSCLKKHTNLELKILGKWFAKKERILPKRAKQTKQRETSKVADSNLNKPRTAQVGTRSRFKNVFRIHKGTVLSKTVSNCQCQKIPKKTPKTLENIFFLSQLEPSKPFLEMIFVWNFIKKKSHSAKNGALGLQNSFFKTQKLIKDVILRIPKTVFLTENLKITKFCIAFNQKL